MILTALARLGRDVELRYLANGDPVANLALAINYGKKGSDGNRPTQWVEAALFGKRAESLAQHLQKGKLLYVVIEEPHIETYEGKNGAGHKMVGRILSLEFAGGGQQDGQQGGSQRQQAPQQQARQQQKPQQSPPQQGKQSGGGFDDFMDDVPF